LPCFAWTTMWLDLLLPCLVWTTMWYSFNDTTLLSRPRMATINIPHYCPNKAWQQ
jgi:hypothetical protein